MSDLELPAIEIPTDKRVQINSLVYSLHLNSTDYQGSEGQVVLFDDKDKNHWYGEEWYFIPQSTDGRLYTIKSASTLNGKNNRPHTYLNTKSDLNYEFALVYLTQSEKTWEVRPSGVLDSFSIHPSDEPGKAIGLQNPGPQGALLWVEPFNGYLNQLWKIGKSTGTTN